MTIEQANATAVSLAQQGANPGVKVTGAKCVRDDGDRFDCLVSVNGYGPVAGTLTCSDGNCLWRPG